MLWMAPFIRDLDRWEIDTRLCAPDGIIPQTMAGCMPKRMSFIMFIEKI